jgi:long-subunit acyl-CoA synthetase (AMP-forming)
MDILELARAKGLPETIPQILERSASLYPDRPALVAREKEGDRSIDYKGLWDEVNLLASGLSAIGVKEKDKVLVLGPNSPEWAKAYFSVARCGAINVPIDSLLSENEIGQLIAKVKAKAAFVAPRFLDVILDAPRGLSPDPKRIICLTDRPEKTA